MSKAPVIVLLIASIGSLSLAQNNNDLLSNILSVNQSEGMNGLEILKILLNPNETLYQKIGQLVLGRELQKLSENGEGVNMSLDKVNTLDAAYVYVINADLTNAQGKSQTCMVTISMRFLASVTDFTFDCEGQSPIVKQLAW